MCQAISGAYFVVIAQSLFANRMLETLIATASSIDPVKVIDTGASEIQNVFSGGELTTVVGAYMVGIKDVFAFAMASSAAAAILALVIPFKRLPDHSKEGTEEVSA